MSTDALTRQCVVCAAAFRPIRKSHLLCRRCWTWLASGRELRDLLRRLEQVSPT